MSTQPIEGACSALPRQSQTNPLQTRAGSAGRPSPVVGGGAQTTDPNEAESNEISRIGSDYDSETAELVRLLLASGFTPSTLAVALTVDDDTLRRWRRGVRASHLARKTMRLLMVVRHIAPSLLTDLSLGTPADLTERLHCAQMRWVSAAEIERERRTAELAEEFKTAPKKPSRWASIAGATWRDGAEGGGL